MPWHPVVPLATCCTSSLVNLRAPMRFNPFLPGLLHHDCSFLSGITSNPAMGETKIRAVAETLWLSAFCIFIADVFPKCPIERSKIYEQLAQLKKNRSLLQCLGWNFRDCNSQNGRDDARWQGCRRRSVIAPPRSALKSNNRGGSDTTITTS